MSSESLGSNSEPEGLTLVDLAKILVRRKYYFALGFMPIIIIALVYLLIREPTYEFQSFYQLAEERSGKYLEEPEVATVRLQNIIIPDVRDQLEKLGFIQLTIETPDKTGLVKLISSAALSAKESVVEFHEALVEELGSSQQKLFEEQQNLLQQRLEAAESQLEGLTNEGPASFRTSFLLEKVNNLELALDTLKAGDVLGIARQGRKPVGVPAALVLIAALALATLVGLFTVYSSEFLSRVRQSLEKDGQ